VNGTVEDSAGSNDGNNNGFVSVTGDYAGGSAAESSENSDDHIDVGEIGMGDLMEGSFAIALSFKTESGLTEGFFGTSTSGNLAIEITTFALSSLSDGPIGIGLSDDNGDDFRMEVSDDSRDGQPHRFVANIESLSGNDGELWLDQKEDTNIGRTESPSGFTDDNIYLGATHSESSVNRNMDEGSIIDDICIFNDTLTEDEIKSYKNPWD